jgi:hypothetical protein
MADERCTRGRHLGEDDEGRCPACAELIERPGLWLIVLVVIVVVLVVG